jgi:nitrite reductase/ring-hydroxylating ferredoxin subunit
MAANARLICLAADLADGGPGVRFTVDWRGTEEAAFAVRFQGRAFAYLNRCGHVPVNSTGSRTSSSMIPSYT